MNKAIISGIASTMAVAALAFAIPADASMMEKLKNTFSLDRGVQYELPINTVQFADKKIAKNVIVESVHAQRTGAESVEVNVRFYNKSKNTAILAVRSSFYDQNKRLTEAPGAWQTVHVKPKSFGFYSTTSMPRYDVAGFLVEVQGQTGSRRF